VRKLAASVVTLGECTVLRLQDTGGGLTDEALLRSGQAFFTSKQYGLGMGLNISRSIAMRFGGSLNLSNFEADGTRGVIAKLSLPGLQVACI
jgi:C4-dicarboxylate-specific signal transduction histidine kinase